MANAETKVFMELAVNKGKVSGAFSIGNYDKGFEVRRFESTVDPRDWLQEVNTFMKQLQKEKVLP